MSLVPNTFQTFNTYVDDAMYLLTDGELRCLLFATRHIMGWQDKIDKQQGCISLSMFENGFVTKDGRIFHGCGLGRKAIITATVDLVRFGFLEKVGVAGRDGQEWKLSNDGIKWELLQSRFDEKSTKYKSQTTKAREVKSTGVSNNTGVVEQTSSGVLNNTMLRVVEQTQSKPLSKPISKPVVRKTQKDWSLEDAIISAWVDATDRFGGFNTNFRRTQAGDLLAMNCTPEIVVEIIKWKRPNGNTMSYEFGYLAEDLPEYLVIKARETKETERAAAAKAKMEETMRINRTLDEQAGVRHAS